MTPSSECVDCGNVPEHLAGVWIDFECHKAWTQEQFESQMERWDAQRAEARRDDAIDNQRDAERWTA